MVGSAVLVTDCRASLLRRIHLGRKRGRVGVNPLQLRQVAVQNANNLAQLVEVH